MIRVSFDKEFDTKSDIKSDIKSDLKSDIEGAAARFVIDGHAEYAEAGEADIVCAAASMLGFTLIGTTGKLFPEGAAYTEIRSGHVEVRFPIEGETGKAALAAAEVIFKGYKLLADAYPESVSFA